MRNIGEEFDYQFENGVMRYVVIAHTLAAANEFVEPVLIEEVRAIKWTPSNTAPPPPAPFPDPVHSADRNTHSMTRTPRKDE